MLILLQDLLKTKRPTLKLVLMSATLQLEKLVEYFPGSATLHMGGSVFPVKEYFLDDVLHLTGHGLRAGGGGAGQDPSAGGDGPNPKS